MRIVCSIIALLCLTPGLAPGEEEEISPATKAGAAIYAKHCASCHGENGEGVDEEYDEPLWGNRSVDSLTRYIHKTMPEEDEEAVVDEDARLVAQYIYDAFYSPAAQARNRPPRVELLRLTNNQYRHSVADLFGSFNPTPAIGPERGLQGRYFNSEKMAKEKEHVLERLDANIDFDFGSGVPVEGMKQAGFSIRWAGALLAPRTGTYEFRLRTHNGALLQLNSFAGDDDENATIDAYVSTGNELQEKTARMELLGGRAYPLYLRYFSYQEKVSSIHLDWKPPHGVWEPIPTEFLSPARVPPVPIVQTKFTPDDRSLGYERGSNVSKEWQEAVTQSAIATVNEVISNLRTIARLPRDQARNPDRLRQFCHDVAERAFRRPLSPEQREFFVDSRFDGQSDPEVAVRHSLLLVLTSPRFLYPGLADNEGVPDSHTVASRLALALWDSLPDAALREAAARGELATRDQISGQVRRMMEDPRTRQKVREFFHHWLAMDEREDLGKNPALYPGFDQQIVADLRTSLEHFVDDVVWSETSDYRQLLQADFLYLNPRLATFYGAQPADGHGFAKVALPGDQRSGIFTHPYLLAANAYYDNTSPIHRGVFLSQKVLGRLLKPPPEAISFKNEDFDPDLTMREKVTQLTSKETCMQCHRVINPVGFSLENFDAVGRWRTEDNDKPVDSASDYVNDRDQKIRIANARDLANLAVDSRAAHRAFLTHLFHHLVKQSTEAYGPENLESLRSQFVDSGYKIRESIVEMAVTTALHAQGEEPVATVTTP